jgi:hypothetical protein
VSSGTNAKDRRSATRSLRRVRNERSGPTSCPTGPRPTLLPGHRPFLPDVRAGRVSLALGAHKVRLMYRPEAVHLTQGQICATTLLEHVCCSFHDGPLPPRCSPQRLVTLRLSLPIDAARRFLNLRSGLSMR